MRITKNIITRDQAMQISSDYVSVAEHQGNWFDLLCNNIIPKFEALKRGQRVLTYLNGQFVICKVSSIRPIPMADGPCVRVSNGEFTWRVDGSDYAYPYD